jgi:CRISPR-associated endonuclease/helicase Cas3
VIIIPYIEEAKHLLQELKYTSYPHATLRKLQVYTVNIYEGEFHNLQSKGVIQTINDTYHVLEENRIKEYYHPKTGLVLPENRGGEAIFFD